MQICWKVNTLFRTSIDSADYGHRDAFFQRGWWRQWIMARRCWRLVSGLLLLVEGDPLQVGRAHPHSLVVQKGDQVGGLGVLIAQVFISHSHGNLVRAGGNYFHRVLFQNLNRQQCNQLDMCILEMFSTFWLSLSGFMKTVSFLKTKIR